MQIECFSREKETDPKSAPDNFHIVSFCHCTLFVHYFFLSLLFDSLSKKGFVDIKCWPYTRIRCGLNTRFGFNNAETTNEICLFQAHGIFAYSFKLLQNKGRNGSNNSQYNRMQKNHL